MSRDDRSQYQLSGVHCCGATSNQRGSSPATSNQRVSSPATSNQRVSSPVNQQPARAASNQSKLPHDANLQVRPTKSSEYNTNQVIRIQYQPSHPNTIPTESSVYHTNRVIRIPYQPSHPYTIPTESSVYNTSVHKPSQAARYSADTTVHYLYTVYTFTSYAVTRVQLVQNQQSVTRMRYKN